MQLECTKDCKSVNGVSSFFIRKESQKSNQGCTKQKTFEIWLILKGLKCKASEWYLKMALASKSRTFADIDLLYYCNLIGAPINRFSSYKLFFILYWLIFVTKLIRRIFMCRQKQIFISGMEFHRINSMKTDNMTC